MSTFLKRTRFSHVSFGWSTKKPAIRAIKKKAIYVLLSFMYPNRRLRRNPHFQTSVSMVDLQAMCFFEYVTAGGGSAALLRELHQVFAMVGEEPSDLWKKCENVEREKTNGKGTDGVFSRFPRCAIFCLETKLKTACIMVKVVWRIHKI